MKAAADSVGKAESEGGGGYGGGHGSKHGDGIILGVGRHW